MATTTINTNITINPSSVEEIEGLGNVSAWNIYSKIEINDQQYTLTQEHIESGAVYFRDEGWKIIFFIEKETNYFTITNSNNHAITINKLKLIK